MDNLELQNFKEELIKASSDLLSDELIFRSEWIFDLPTQSLEINGIPLHEKYKIPTGFNGYGLADLEKLERSDFLIKITREDGTIVCPYISNRRGKEFIGQNDYIVWDEDGTKHVCGADKIWKRYEKIEDVMGTSD